MLLSFCREIMNQHHLDVTRHLLFRYHLLDYLINQGRCRYMHHTI